MQKNTAQTLEQKKLDAYKEKMAHKWEVFALFCDYNFHIMMWRIDDKGK